MTTGEILRRSENGISLFTAATEELVAARAVAARKIQQCEIDRELKTRKKEERASKRAVDNSLPKPGRFNHSGPRVPTKRELR